jgi:hypothetical protein
MVCFSLQWICLQYVWFLQESLLMNFEFSPHYIPFLLIGGIAVFFLLRAVKYGGFKGALFGARITRTVGEVDTSGGRFSSTVVKVHMLEGGADGRDVGLELVSKGAMRYHMTPLSLSVAGANELIRSLQAAVEGRSGFSQ